MTVHLSTRELVVTLAETGMPARRIIELTSLSPKLVYRWTDQARQRGRAVRPQRHHHKGIMPPDDALTRARLKAEATRRGLTETQLIHLILGVVAADDLFHAILEGAY